MDFILQLNSGLCGQVSIGTNKHTKSPSLSTNKCTHYTNIYFTLSGHYMFQSVAILSEFTTK